MTAPTTKPRPPIVVAVPIFATCPTLPVAIATGQLDAAGYVLAVALLETAKAALAETEAGRPAR